MKIEEIEESKKPANYILTARSVMGALALCAVQQSPYPYPENLELVLGKFNDLIKNEVNSSINQYIKKFDTWKEAHDWIASKLYIIPEFTTWNNRKNGRDGMGFSGAGYRDDGSVAVVSKDPNPDDDFIDLDALTRNITDLATQD